ncbi:MAG TPA: DUF2252 family protein [Puia sp.]|nr:DUF2252 family protein [Puia sp.]
MPTIPERVKDFNKERLQPYTALKYQMMSQSAFRFFRGTCHLFYEDLCKVTDLPNSPLTWICGDLHLENYGSYKGDNRLVYFDLNDFDEAVLAPAVWEICRMATSIFVGFDSLRIEPSEARDAAAYFLKVYSETLSKGKSKYIEPETAKGIVKTFLDNVAERKQKELLRQRTIEKNGKLSFAIDNAHFYKLDKDVKKELLNFLDEWLKTNRNYKNGFKILDTAFRIAGTGSIGVKRYAFLVEKMQNPSKYMLVDMKEATLSSVQPYLSISQPTWAAEADRVVAIQQRMQNVSPAFLSSVTYKNDSYILKELQPLADKIDFVVIKDKLKDIQRVIEDMAMLTASAQLRSSGRQGSAIADELIAFGQNQEWQKRIIDYAVSYSAQVKKDYDEFAKAYNEKYFS